jgi:hypothetical protein
MVVAFAVVESGVEAGVTLGDHLRRLLRRSLGSPVPPGFHRLGLPLLGGQGEREVTPERPRPRRGKTPKTGDAHRSIKGARCIRADCSGRAPVSIISGAGFANGVLELVVWHRGDAESVEERQSRAPLTSLQELAMRHDPKLPLVHAQRVIGVYVLTCLKREDPHVDSIGWLYGAIGPEVLGPHAVGRHALERP